MTAVVANGLDLVVVLRSAALQCGEDGWFHIESLIFAAGNSCTVVWPLIGKQNCLRILGESCVRAGDVDVTRPQNPGGPEIRVACVLAKDLRLQISEQGINRVLAFEDES